MEREIKFRGIGKQSKEWQYGDLIHVNDNGIMKYYILCENYDGHNIELDTCNSVEVTAKTVGQYTGLKDKNGVEIFEGDIVSLIGDKKYKGIIKYDLASFMIDTGKIVGDLGNIDIDEQFLEVIGNIYDNKELLE